MFDTSLFGVVALCLLSFSLPCSALNMLLPLPTYLAAARDIESLPVGEGTIINTGPLALRKVRTWGFWHNRHELQVVATLVDALLA